MNVFKKIWNGIKKAAHWVAEKARKFKSWCKEHKDEISVVAGVAAVAGVGIIAAKAGINDTSYTPPTREEKMRRDANNMMFKARFEDDQEKAQVYLRNAEILNNMSIKERSEHAKDEIRKYADFYEKYSESFDKPWVHLWVNDNPSEKIYDTDDDFAQVSVWDNHIVSFSNFADNDIFKVKDLGKFGESLLNHISEINPDSEVEALTISAMRPNIVETTFVEEG